MSKTQDEFLDHFARLGVFSKVQALMGSNNESDSDVIKSSDSIAKGWCPAVLFLSPAELDIRFFETR